MSNEIKRYQTNTRMSQVVVANGYVHLAGQIPDVENASVTAQTQNVLERVDLLLASVGVDKTRLIAATLWLSDVKHFAEFNRVWDAWVPEGHAPTRACVQSLLINPGCDVEVAVLALARSDL